MNLDSLREMRTLFGWMESFIHAAVTRAQAVDHSPNDALRGLVITDAEVATHLSRDPLSDFWPEAVTPPNFAQLAPESPFARLMQTFALNDLDAAILLLCLAPEFDRRYERLYAYLQDDVSQRRPTVNLMMNLLGGDLTARFSVRERLNLDNPLRRAFLVEASPDSSQPNGTFLSYHLRADARIAAHLLGDSLPDARLKNAIRRLDNEPKTALMPEIPEAIAQTLDTTIREAAIAYLRGTNGVGRREAITVACAAYDLPLTEIDLSLLNALDIGLEKAWPLALREAYLAESALLLRNWDTVCDESSGQPLDELLRALFEYPAPVFICGKNAWEPLEQGRSRRVLRLSLELPAYPERRRLWEQALAHHNAEKGRHLNVEEIAQKYRFTPTQIALAVNTAADLAATRGQMLAMADLVAGAQAHSSLKLGRLARQVTPRHNWDDLILPPDRIEQLRELRTRAENTHLVSDVWGFRRKIAPRPGISALFAGESGTGKTMSAEVIATDLGLVMYRIDLSSVVSKYIGETEKNLAVIFEEAHASNAILFFDEADALFGKRSEVKDAHDRYANIETAYLLQQIEDYDGIAILATNLRQNLDEAFTRRLDFVIDFPFPEADDRKRIWQVHFPSDSPLAPEVNLRELAERYPLAGGNIRNAALASAYLAAADGKTITMAHIRHAIRREHQKMGRLVD